MGRDPTRSLPLHRLRKCVIAAQANLGIAVSPDQPLLDKGPEYDGVAVLGETEIGLVGISVRVEMDESDRPLRRRYRSDARVGDPVIAAERERYRTSFDHFSDYAPDRLRAPIAVALDDGGVAVIDQPKGPEGIGADLG